MARAECGESSTLSTDPPMSIMEGSDDASSGEYSGSMSSLFRSISSGSRKFVAEERPDLHRTKSVAGRRMQYVREVYSHWADNLACIALGVVLMSTTREANVQEQVHFLYLALGGNFLRSHRGQTYIYEDGAFHLFNGVVPEYMISRCKEFAESVEGGIWCIGKRGDTSRSETDIFAALDRAYKSISASETEEGESTSFSSAAAESVGGERRGVKRKTRSWMEVDTGDAPVCGCPINEAKVVEELILLTLDMWRTKESKAPATSWTNTEALNCQEMIRKIMEQVIKGAIIPYYAEYLDEWKDSALGFCLEDACFVHSNDATRALGGDMLRQVKKSPKNNIYMHIERRITDPLVGAALTRLELFLSRTFYNNERALECTMCALTLCFLGYNVDRAFWSIGGGGVGQSLFTSLINNAFYPKHGFFDCAALYQDDEMRKYVDLLSPFCVWTAQEGTEGGSEKIKHLRQDLYKKFCSGDPMAARLPYAIATKQVPLRGLLRFELNKPLTFAGISESNWDSIYRRSLVVELRGKFVPHSEICGKAGVFPKDDTLKEFVESKPAAAVFLHLLVQHMNKHTMYECIEKIDSYARMGGGPTWRIMRKACNLGPDVQKAIGEGESDPPLGGDERRLRELSDALAVVAIEHDTDVNETPSSLNALWKMLAPPNIANAPQGEDVARDHFARMKNAGLWIPHGKTYKGIASYCPKLVSCGNIDDIHGSDCDASEPTLPEVVNMNSLERYARSNARWENALIIRDFD